MKHTNSVFKKALSVFLCAVMMLSVISVGIIVPGAKLTADAAEYKSAASICGDFTFIVPEAIYLTPVVNSWKDTTSASFQYYINNTTANAPKNTRDTSGLLYYSYDGANNASLSYQFLSSDLSSVLGSGSITTNLSNNTMTKNTSHSITGGSSPDLAAGVTGCYIEWCLTFNDSNDGNKQKKAYAYTYVYKPYTVPVAGATRDKNNDGTRNYQGFAQSIGWLTGFHSISGTGNRYPRYGTSNSTKGLSAFLSYDTGVQTSRATTVNTSDKYLWVLDGTFMKSAFYNATDSSSYFYAAKNSEVPGSGDWFTEDGSGSFNVKSATYVSYEKGDENTYALADVAAKGVVTIDISRYSNLNQIPNLGVGFMVTDNEKADGNTAYWLVGDMTGLSNSYGATGTTAKKINGIATQINYKLAGCGTNRDNSNNGNDKPGVYYTGNWKRELTSDASKEYQVKTFYVNENSNEFQANAQILHLTANQYNKSNLRTAVKNATAIMARAGVNGASNGVLSSMYFDADNNYKWNTFQSAYKAAVMALTKVDGTITNPDTLASNLNNAIKNLQTKVTIDANNGTLFGTTTAWVRVGTDNYKLANTYNYTLACTATRKGYTFKGWDVTPDSAYPQPSQVTVGYNDTVYAIWEENQYTATFIKQVPTASSATTLSTANYTINSTFGFPASVSEDYYTFDRTWEVVNTSEDYWTLTNTFGAGNTSTAGAYGNVTFKAKLTPVEYTITFDPAGGAAVNEQNKITYNYTTDTALPVSTRTGYTFAGWKPSALSGNWDPTVTYTSIQKMHNDVTLVAQWTSVSSTVTLNLGEGVGITGNTSLSYAFANPLQLNNPTKTGYKFKGWKVTQIPGSYTSDIPAANRWVIDHEYLLGSDANVTLPANMIGDVTLTPIWEPIQYTITYNTNGGTACANTSYNITSSVSLASTAKNGYTFTGWSVTSHDDVYNWTASTYAAGGARTGMYGNITLTANWTANAYTVTLDVNGGDALTDNTLAYNIEGVTALPQPTRTGYDFLGWKLTSCDTQSDWATYTGRPADDIYTDALPQGHFGSLTLTAQWAHKQYTITLNTAGSNNGTKTYYIDSASFTLGASALPGYSFKNWKVNADAGNWTKDETYLATAAIVNKYGNVTLTAQFEPVSYTITYKNEHGEQIGAAVSYTIEDTVSLNSYSVAGYTFDGWKVVSVTAGGGWMADSVLAAEELGANMYYGNVVLEPVLTPVEYKLTFVSDGGTTYPQKTYTIETDDYTLPAPTKNGYDFAGWKVTAAAGSWTENAVFAAGTSVTGKYGSATLTATWTPKQYLIKYIVGNTTLYPDGITKQGTFGQTAPDLTDAEKAKPADAQYSYTFDHWDPALTTVTGETTYTAGYTKTLRSYDITWMLPDDAGGTLDNYTAQTTPNVNYGDTPVFNNGVNPTLTSDFPDEYSWRFAGWSTTAGGTVLESVPAVTGTATYYAVFTKVLAPEEVNWVINGVTNTELWGIGETPEWKHDTPSKPDANGYKFTFTGWAPSIVPVEQGSTYTYTAQFASELQTYTCTLALAGGTYEGALEGTYKMGDTITFPAPEKTGYTFAGWKLDAAVGTWAADTTVNAGDFVTNTLWGSVSFTAQWTPATYTITYNKASAEDVVPAAQNYNIESAETLGTAKREGYTLSGWVVATASGNWTQGANLAASTVLTGFYGNVTLTPVWQVNTYTITWISGDAEQTSEVEYGSAIVAFPPSSRMGYTADWDAEVPATMPAADLTFTAVYTPVEYYVRVNVNGGSEVENFYYTINGDNTLPTPTRDGATFAGWKVTAAAGNWSGNAIMNGGASLNGKYGNVSLTAQWNMRTCTVIWNAGDTVKTTVWYYGSTPSFDGTPYKSPDEENSYVFAGWDKEIVPVTEDEVTYTALFTPTERVYTVIWNIDGANTTQYYHYGDTPVYEGATPVRPETSEYIFTFTGWSPEVSTVTKDVTYTAQFGTFTKIQGLSLDVSSMFMEIEDTAALHANIYPANATVKDVVWSSSDPSVAAIDAAGNITAVKNGVAVIKVASVDGAFNSYCVVTVNARITNYVQISAGNISTTQLPGTSIQLSAVVMPDNATDTSIVWTSSDNNVAMVDANGLVTFKTVGSATITAKAKDGFAVGSIDVVTASDETEVEDAGKTYLVSFASVSGGFILLADGKETAPITDVCLKMEEGTDIVFKLVNKGFYPLVNGVSYGKPGEDGWYRISSLSKNMAIVDEIVPIGIDVIDPDKEENNAPSFWQRVQNFFKMIVNFFRNLFK